MFGNFISFHFYFKCYGDFSGELLSYFGFRCRSTLEAYCLLSGNLFRLLGHIQFENRVVLVNRFVEHD